MELAPSSTQAIDRNFFTGADAETVADVDALERNVALDAVFYETSRFGSEVEERSKGAAGSGAGAKLENLAEQNERGDDGGGLEVERESSHTGSEGCRDGVRKKCGDEAEQVGCAGAERDQGEHIQVAVKDGGPGTLEEWPAAPKHNGRGEGELKRRGDSPGEKHEEQKWNGEDDTDPEAPRHVLQFGIGFFAGDFDGLQRHAAFGARTGTELAHLGMHRAGVFGLS